MITHSHNGIFQQSNFRELGLQITINYVLTMEPEINKSHIMYFNFQFVLKTENFAWMLRRPFHKFVRYKNFSHINSVFFQSRSNNGSFKWIITFDGVFSCVLPKPGHYELFYLYWSECPLVFKLKYTSLVNTENKNKWLCVSYNIKL